MKIECPHCRGEIPSGDINIQTCIAKCARCSAVFGFAEQVPGSQAPYRKPQVDMPAKFSVTQDGSDLLLVYRWFSLGLFALLFFCVFWDGFLVFWYAMAFSKKAPLLMVLFPLGHLGVGVFLTYVTAAGFVNRTFVRAGTDRLSIRHLPLPWPGQREISRTEIEQLFCSEKIGRTRNGSSTASYQVEALLRGGKRVKLVSGLDKPEQALFIEQKIESYLGIADRPVAGEM
ncbi:MAG TPA: hypothetical protein DEB40_09455 [Elusimicrobia bacterium]|nr:hypothetical protein [Elusimicrobiota bacterium]HBT61956.1 hypothetical protein [Elusimicrobiota bacterium]